MTTEREHEERMREILSKKLAAIAAGFDEDDVVRLDGIERCMKKFHPYREDNIPVMTEQMHDDGLYAVSSPFGITLVHIIMKNNIDPLNLMVRAWNLEWMDRQLRKILTHSREQCDHGALCQRFDTMDILITHSRMPMWTKGAYIRADERDFLIMRDQLSVWKNWRSIMKDDR